MFGVRILCAQIFGSRPRRSRWLELTLCVREALDLCLRVIDMHILCFVGHTIL